MVYKIGLSFLFCAVLAGCGNGPSWLGTGLAIEALLDPVAEDGEDGLDGEDSTVPGPAGEDGADSTVPGPAGPAGPPGITTVIVVHRPAVVDPPDDEPEDDSPPPGHAYGHLTPPGNSRGPDGHRP